MDRIEPAGDHNVGLVTFYVDTVKFKIRPKYLTEKIEPDHVSIVLVLISKMKICQPDVVKLFGLRLRHRFEGIPGDHRKHRHPRGQKVAREREFFHEFIKNAIDRHQSLRDIPILIGPSDELDGHRVIHPRLGILFWVLIGDTFGYDCESNRGSNHKNSLDLRILKNNYGSRIEAIRDRVAVEVRNPHHPHTEITRTPRIPVKRRVVHWTRFGLPLPRAPHGSSVLVDTGLLVEILNVEIPGGRLAIRLEAHPLVERPEDRSKIVFERL